jgi:peptidoglycan/LPS O-acetylase OafA/YrhL
LSAAEQPRWLQWRPLAAIGVASYSLYLWHEPVLRVLHDYGLLPAKTASYAFPWTAGLLIAVSVPVALVSYRVLERASVLILAAFDGQGRPRDYYAGSAVAAPDRSSR